MHENIYCVDGDVIIIFKYLNNEIFILLLEARIQEEFLLKK